MTLLLATLAACYGPVDTGDVDSDVPPVEFTAIGLNVESGGSDAQVVADETIALIEGEALWGLSEVEHATSADRLVNAMADEGSEQRFEHVLGTTGYSDRLVLAWDDTRFEMLSHEELDDINVGGTARAPLVGHLRERDSGIEFLLVVNHLWRTETESRHEQAELLNAWGAEQSLPVIMVGDYNFDWDVDGSYHDEGYDLLVEDGVFEWLQPDPLVQTQCSTTYDSVLDFAFVGGEARAWDAVSDVLRAEDEYCSYRNRDTYSDHRPLETRFAIER